MVTWKDGQVYHRLLDMDRTPVPVIIRTSAVRTEKKMLVTRLCTCLMLYDMRSMLSQLYSDSISYTYYPTAVVGRQRSRVDNQANHLHRSRLLVSLTQYLCPYIDLWILHCLWFCLLVLLLFLKIAAYIEGAGFGHVCLTNQHFYVLTVFVQPNFRIAHQQTVLIFTIRLWGH